MATLTDYAAVRGLVAKLFAEGIEATVPPTVRETVTAVGASVGGGVGEISLTALAKILGLDKNSAHHRVRKAIERGYLVNREEKRRMPARIAIADPLPDEIEILPPVEALGDCWSVGASMEGIKKEEGEEGGESEAEQLGAPLPLDQHSNTPTPPVPSDYDAVLEELAARGEPRGQLVGDRPPSQAGARVWLREIWPPELGPPGDDVFDIDPQRWRQ